jgi:prepilin-type N-terminal cleavage/methylation domain-containing protein
MVTSKFRSDQGMSLVEIVVAMFILAMLSLALIPALIAAVKQSASNTLLSSATHLVSARLDEARVQSATCSAVAALAAQAVPETKSANGVMLRIAQLAGPCPAAYPGTVKFTASVYRADSNALLATAATLVYVQSAN